MMIMSVQALLISIIFSPNLFQICLDNDGDDNDDNGDDGDDIDDD